MLFFLFKKIRRRILSQYTQYGKNNKSMNINHKINIISLVAFINKKRSVLIYKLKYTGTLKLPVTYTQILIS